MLSIAEEGNDCLFVVEMKGFNIVRRCPCHTEAFWRATSGFQVYRACAWNVFTTYHFFQKGHVCRVQFTCSKCQHTRTWASSPVFGGQYLVNQRYCLKRILYTRVFMLYVHSMRRLVHAFTSAGILPSQYTRFCNFAHIGKMGYWYLGKGLYSKVAMFWLEHCTQFSLQEEPLHGDSQPGCRRKHECGR